MAHQNDGYMIYLTEPEAERMRKTAKDRNKWCSKVSGNARTPREAIAAIQEATGASLMADMGGAPDPDMTQAQGGTLPAFTVGQPYPPCTKPLEGTGELQEMKISDLRLETHHRGKKLVIKRASPVVTLAVRSWCMVQDEEGKQTERLEMGLHKTRHGEEILETTKRFIVKDPYFTLNDQGEATLRLDHPSDLVALRDEIPNNIKDAEKAAASCKKKGNAALKEQDLPEACARYVDGVKIASLHDKPDLLRDTSRNLAHVHLLLGQFDQAITAAKASYIGGDDPRSKDLDSKACFRAGGAAYSLGDFLAAKSFFEEQQKLTPDDKDGKVFLKRSALRLREQDTGVHDFAKIRLGFSQARPRVDTATFIANTTIKTSSGKGRGLFAIRNIAVGEVVMCEKAFCVVYGHEKEAMTAMTYDLRDDKIRVSPVGLSKAIVQKLLSNPSQIGKVMDLYGDYQGDAKDTFIDEHGNSVVDVFRVHDIISRNAFGHGNQFGQEGARNASTGLWIHAAYINHSCIPNASKDYIGDLMILRASRPIIAGDEIFHAYDESSDYDTRQAALQLTWGFECSCELCEAEKQDEAAVRRKREELRGEADAFVAREHWAGAKRLVIAKAQRLAKGIDETYDAERYKGLPRLAGGNLRDWLAKATPRR
jgi:tetratricopeptide (TPR) repeat protein